MKNMKLVFIFIFLIMAVTALAYRMYSGIPESGDGTFEESITPDNGGDVRVAGGADKAYMAAEELMANAEFKDAAAALEDAIKEFPGEARFYNLLGQSEALSFAALAR